MNKEKDYKTAHLLESTCHLQLQAGGSPTLEQLERPVYYSNRREGEANLDLHFLSDTVSKYQLQGILWTE